MLRLQVLLQAGWCGQAAAGSDHHQCVRAHALAQDVLGQRQVDVQCQINAAGSQFGRQFLPCRRQRLQADLRSCLSLRGR